MLLEKRPFSRGNKRTIVCLAEGQVTWCCWTRSLSPAASAESLISVQTAKCLFHKVLVAEEMLLPQCDQQAVPHCCWTSRLVGQSRGGSRYCSWQNTVASSVKALQYLATEMPCCCQRSDRACSPHQQQVSGVCSGSVCTVLFWARIHSRCSSRYGH